MDNNIANVNNAIRDYKNSIAGINRLRGEIESDKSQLEQAKTDIVSRLNAAGFSGKAVLEQEISRLNGLLIPDCTSMQLEYSALVQSCGLIEGQKSAYETIRGEKEKDLKKIDDEYALNTQVYGFLIGLTDSIRNRTKEKIETIVTGGINQIFNFNPPFKFKIDISLKGNQHYAEFLLENDTASFSSSVLDSYGGGVSDVVGTILRLCLLEFQVPKNSAPVVLDEVGKFISTDYQERFADFLKAWSSSFGRQIILVSHKPEIVSVADKVIRIDKGGPLGVSTVV